MGAVARRALERFDGLAATFGAGQEAEREAAERAIIFEYGLFAIGETGDWLRAHREREVEQPFLG